MNILGIDIGGSALKGAPVDTTTGRLLAPRFRVPTKDLVKPKRMAEIVVEIATHFSWTGPIGLGFPGVIHGPKIMTAANLHPDFVGIDALKLFSKATRLDVSVINDADAAGLAEVRFGAGKKRRGTILLLTFGTGVGSALVVDGRLYPNSEFGHLPFDGDSAEKIVAASVKERRGWSYKKWAKHVSEYLVILETILWPELIIVGGGISADSTKWFKYLKIRTPIVPAKFLNEAGIVGAALWAAHRKTE